jgi:PEP-CTERM motif
MHLTLKTALGAAVALLITVPAQATTSLATWAFSDASSTSKLLINGTTLLTATSRGWVKDTGANNGGGVGANFVAGRCGSSDACSGDDSFYNNYFIFNLANVTGAITSAVLQLSQGPQGYISPTPSLTYTLWDSSVAPSAMASTSSVAYYNDLGSGTSFGSVVVTAATNNTIVSFNLNAAGLSALNAGRGTFVGFGGSVSTAVSNPVPEPATWAMMLAGFGIVGGAMRRRQRTSVSFG